MAIAGYSHPKIAATRNTDRLRGHDATSTFRQRHERHRNDHIAEIPKNGQTQRRVQRLENRWPASKSPSAGKGSNGVSTSSSLLITAENRVRMSLVSRSVPCSRRWSTVYV